MDITLNGEPCQLPDHFTIRDLMRKQFNDPAYVAVAVNQQVIPRSQHPEITLQPGDRVEIVQAVGGG